MMTRSQAQRIADRIVRAAERFGYGVAIAVDDVAQIGKATNARELAQDLVSGHSIVHGCLPMGVHLSVRHGVRDVSASAITVTRAGHSHPAEANATEAADGDAPFFNARKAAEL